MDVVLRLVYSWQAVMTTTFGVITLATRHSAPWRQRCDITPWSVFPGIQDFYKKAFIKHRIGFGMRVNYKV